MPHVVGRQADHLQRRHEDPDPAGDERGGQRGFGAIDGLPAVHERLRRVLIECRPAVELMAGHDVEGAVMYADPPYLPSTRTAPGVYGEYEMSEADHREFLAAARAVRHARLLVSGYPSELYDRELAGWRRVAFDIANHAAGGTTKRRMTETVWMNF